MNNCVFILGEESVNVFSSINLLSRVDHDLLNRTHPGFRLSERQANSLYQLIYIEQTGPLTVEYKTRCVNISGAWSLTNGGQLLVYAVYPFIELQRQEKGLITTHASVVQCAGNGIGLFGNIGAGKSSVLLGLCMERGGQLVGNDISILGLQNGQLFCRGGAQDFILRYESVQRNLPQLTRYFPVHLTDPWSTKIRLSAEELSIPVYYGGCTIDQAYLVHVDDRMTECFVEKRSDITLKVMLNENFSRYIRGSCLVLLGGQDFDYQGFVPSFDRSDLAKFRYRVIDKILQCMTYIAGPLNKVVQSITKATRGLNGNN